MNDLETREAEAEQAEKEALDWLEENLPDDEEDTEQEDTEEEEESEGDGESSGNERDSAEYKGALKEIERKYKLGAAAIAAMSPQEIIAMGERIATERASYVGQLNELDRLKKGNSAGERHEEGREEEQDGNAVRPSANSKELDFSEHLGPLDTELLGDGFVPALKGSLNAITQALGSQMSAAIDGLRSEIRGELQAERDSGMDAAIRQGLEERFPSLKDSDKAIAVSRVMQDLSVGVKQEEGEDRRSYRRRLMELALLSVDPEGVAESANRKVSQRGGPTPPKKRSERKVKPKSMDERNEHFLELLETGMNPDEAARTAGV